MSEEQAAESRFFPSNPACTPKNTINHFFLSSCFSVLFFAPHTVLFLYQIINFVLNPFYFSLNFFIILVSAVLAFVTDGMKVYRLTPRRRFRGEKLCNFNIVSQSLFDKIYCNCTSPSRDVCVSNVNEKMFFFLVIGHFIIFFENFYLLLLPFGNFLSILSLESFSGTIYELPHFNAISQLSFK